MTLNPMQCGTKTFKKTNETSMKMEDEEKFHARLPAQVPVSSVAKISRWHRAQCQAKKTGKIEEKVANAQEKEVKTVPSFTSCGGKKAMVPMGVRGRCSIVRLAKLREGLGVQSLADLATLPLTG